MMFLFKSKPIVVDAFTKNAGIYEYFQPASAMNFVPTWWKNLPKNIDVVRHGISIPHATMKQCDGFIEQYKNSFIVPLWADLAIETREDGYWSYVFSTEDTPNINEHQEHMTRDVDAFKHLIQLKLTTPWLFTEKDGVKFQLMEPFWNRIERTDTLHTAPGILNFKDQNAVVNVFLSQKQNQTIRMQSGDPLLQYVPLSDRKVVVKSHLVDDTEWKRIHDRKMYVSSFSGVYRKNKKRCPFH